MLTSCSPSEGTKDDLLEDSRLLSKEYTNIYKGTYNKGNLDSDLIDEKVIKYVDSYNKELKARDKGYMDVDKFFYNYFEGNELGLVKEAGTYEVLQKKDVVDDKRIFEKDGKKYIELKELDPTNSSFEYVPYRSVEMLIDMSYEFDLLTYKKILNSSDYKYSYTSSEYVESDKGNDKILVLFTAINGSNTLKFTYTIDSSKIVKMDVNKFVKSADLD